MTAPDPPPPTVEERLARLEVAMHRLMGERPPPVVSWTTTTDPDTATAMLVDLVEWVHTVWLVWRDAQLPGCWMRHPDIVEELWGLRNLWLSHESRGGSWVGRVDWLERHRPGAAKRIAQRDRKHDDCGADPQYHPTRPTDEDIAAVAALHCDSTTPST